MKKSIKILSLVMLMAGSFTYAQTSKKIEPSSSDVNFASSPTSKLSLTIRIIIGRTSQNCGGFGICKGTTIDVGLKQTGTSANGVDGYLVENGVKGKNYLRLDLASTIDTSKYDDTLRLDNDVDVEINGGKYTLSAGSYSPQFDSNRNGSYYVAVK